MIKVSIQDNRTGERTQPRAFIVPEPGLTVVWDFRTTGMSDDISVRVDWPKKSEG